MKALIVGIDSQIGGALAESLRQVGFDIHGTSRRRIEGKDLSRLDLSDLGGLALLPSCDVAFLCAAETRLATCRNDLKATTLINVVAPATIASHFVRQGSFVIFLSSNAVFDGIVPHRLADSPMCPTTPYGAQKAAAERQILGLGDSVAILRLTKVLTPTLALFKGWIEALKNGREVTPFGDMMLAPVPVSLVTEALARIAEQRAGGIFQASASRDVSYAEAVHHIACRLGAHPDLVRPGIAGVDIPTADLPCHTTLDATRLSALIGRPAPDPFDVIDEVFQLQPVRMKAV